MSSCATSRRRFLGDLAATALLASLGGRAGAQTAAPAATTATPSEIAARLPGARLLGRGRLNFLGLHVYDARLWAAEPFKPADFEKTPLALELEYARALKGDRIAERSLTEMKRNTDIAADKAERWLATLKQHLPDVGPGDRVVGVQLPGAATLFFHNGQARGELRDAEFTRLFFGIWLSPQTSEPKLREALLAGTG